MSRRRLPRRFPLLLTAALAAAALLAGGPEARAQLGDPADRDREIGARTVIGAPHAQACVNAVAGGDSSDQALDQCTRAVERERLSRPTRIAILVNRGAMHLRRREGQAALDDFDTVIRLDRRHAEAHLNRGAALVMLQQPGPAVAAITEALGLGVAEPHKAYFNRGAAREALGDVRGAYEDYSTALEIQPDWGPANEELARFARGRREHLAEVLNEDTATP